MDLYFAYRTQRVYHNSKLEFYKKAHGMDCRRFMQRPDRISITGLRGRITRGPRQWIGSYEKRRKTKDTRTPVQKLYRLVLDGLGYTIQYNTIYYILYTIYYILYTIYYILYTIYYILYTIYYILYTIYYILYTIYYILYTILYYMIADL